MAVNWFITLKELGVMPSYDEAVMAIEYTWITDNGLFVDYDSVHAGPSIDIFI
jgi:hypothetical protein